MKVIPLFVLLTIFYETSGGKLEEWTQFKLDYNKMYKTRKEEKKRFRIFKKNIREIRLHNKKYRRGLETFLKGINEFGDITHEEFTIKYGINDSKNLTYYNTTKAVDSDQSSGVHLDWSKRGAVSPVQDQGSCGACWIFSAVGALEGYFYRKHNRLLSLSEQDVVDCFPEDACDGGVPEDAFEFVRSVGINTEEEYPYEEKKSTCRHDLFHSINITYGEAVQVENTEEALKKAVTKYGPVSVCMYVTSKWMFYKKGVWYDSECSEADSNHCLLLVGYGREKGLDYWLLKNSWGKFWGEEGYIRIARNKHENYCGITGGAMYLI